MNHYFSLRPQLQTAQILASLPRKPKRNLWKSSFRIWICHDSRKNNLDFIVSIQCDSSKRLRSLDFRILHEIPIRMTWVYFTIFFTTFFFFVQFCRRHKSIFLATYSLYHRNCISPENYDTIFISINFWGKYSLSRNYVYP